MKIAFVGDCMPGGVLPYHNNYISKEVAYVLQQCDFRIGTLECAIGDGLPFDESKMSENGRKNIIYAREEDFYRIKELNLNLVSLANNHVYDLGKDGLLNTIKILEKNNIKYCGAGLNVEKASAPCIVSIQGVNVAFIGCCFMGLPPWRVQIATKDTAGVFYTNPEEVCGLIREAKRNAEYVVVLPHWGTEYSYLPPMECQEYAKTMIKAGADAIVGSHTHIINPKAKYNNKPIFYSLGNFLFPDFCIQVPRPIFYPKTKKEAEVLPTIINYPSIVDVPSRVVWGDSSRTGILLLMHFDSSGDIHTNTLFSYLRTDNVLTMLSGYRKLKEILRLEYYSFLYNSVMFHFIRRVYYSKCNIFRYFKR